MITFCGVRINHYAGALEYNQGKSVKFRLSGKRFE